MHIFIVDDDPSFGRSLKRMLRARSMKADHFESAQAFIDSVPSDQQGIAIVDLHMPECDGFSLMKKMQELHYGMPVIAISGHSMADFRNQAIRLGAVGFLQKPFNERSLLALIEAQTEDGNEVCRRQT